MRYKILLLMWLPALFGLRAATVPAVIAVSADGAETRYELASVQRIVFDAGGMTLQRKADADDVNGVRCVLFGTMEQMHDVMMLLASGAQAAALAAALVAGFFAVAMRVRALALLRALGASHGFLAVSVWLMVSGVLFAGSALGLGLGCLMASAASSWIQAETGVALTVTLTAGDALAALAAAGCGCLAAFLPAWFACRRTAGELLRSA